MGCAGLAFAKMAASCALEYALETQMRELNHVQSLHTYSSSEFMILDSITLRNLEVVRNVRGEGKDTTILQVLDETKTPMGSRLLQKWILKPLLDSSHINKRLDAVEELSDNTLLRFDVRSHLSYVKDVERLVGRVVYGNSNARDLVALKKSLQSVPSLLETLKGEHKAMLARIVQGMEDFREIDTLTELIERAIVEEPPLSVREGGLIKPGYSEELDELKETSSNAKSWMPHSSRRRGTGPGSNPSR
jgi:DNA mismatch repair protein MutS